MQNSYSPMVDNQQEGWPFKIHRIGRGFLGRQPSQRAPPRLHERPMLVVETPELDMVDILSSTVNHAPAANINAGPVDKRQNILEDPRRFNVLETKNNDNNSSVFGTLKRKISDHPATHRLNSPLATRETPASFGDREQRPFVNLASHNLPEQYNARPATPKIKQQSRPSPPVSAARSLGRKLSRKFSRKGKGNKLDIDAYAAYPPDMKKSIPDPVAHHPACIDVAYASASPPASVSSSNQTNSSRQNFSRKDVRRPATSNSQNIPLSSKNPITIRKMFSSSSLRNKGRIATDLPATEAEEIISPPPTYTASMDFYTNEKPKVDIMQHPALADAANGAHVSISSSDSQLKYQTTDLLRSTTPIPEPVPETIQSRSRALSNAQTVRSSIDLHDTNKMTTQFTHDTVAPLLIGKDTRGRGSSPKRFTSLQRSLSDFKSSRPIPSRSQSQDTGVANLSPTVKRTESTRSKSYYTLGSLEPAVPGVSRSLTVSNAKRNSAISSLNAKRISGISTSQATATSIPVSANARNSIATIRSVPHNVEFLPIQGSSPATTPLRNFSRPGTTRCQTETQVPRRVKKSDFINIFEVPNLMMDCGGYDEHSCEEYTYSEFAPYSTGQMIRHLAQGGTAGAAGSVDSAASDSESGEFAKFIADAEREAREEQPKVVGRDGIMRENIHLRGERRKGVWGSIRRRDGGGVGVRG